MDEQRDDELVERRPNNWTDRPSFTSRLLACLADKPRGLRPIEIKEIFPEIRRATINQTLMRLKDERRLVNPARGVWRLPREGEVTKT